MTKKGKVHTLLTLFCSLDVRLSVYAFGNCLHAFSSWIFAYFSLMLIFFQVEKKILTTLWSSADHTHLEINDQNSYHCNLQFITFQIIYTYMGLMTIVSIQLAFKKILFFFFSASQILTTNFRTQRPILSRSERVNWDRSNRQKKKKKSKIMVLKVYLFTRFNFLSQMQWNPYRIAVTGSLFSFSCSNLVNNFP